MNKEVGADDGEHSHFPGEDGQCVHALVAGVPHHEGSLLALLLQNGLTVVAGDPLVVPPDDTHTQQPNTMCSPHSCHSLYTTTLSVPPQVIFVSMWIFAL